MSLATCMCLLQTISCPAGSGSSGPSTACPAKGRGDAGRSQALVRYQREDDADECLQMVEFLEIVELLEMPLWELVEDAKPWALMPFWGLLWRVEKSWEQADTPAPLDE